MAGCASASRSADGIAPPASLSRSSTKRLTSDSGSAPWNTSAIWPCQKAATVGTDCIGRPICTSCWTRARLASMSILTSLTRPPAAFVTFSSVGVSCLQGPHQVAQKSTMTGTAREASTTSCMKVAWVPSTIIAPGVHRLCLGSRLAPYCRPAGRSSYPCAYLPRSSSPHRCCRPCTCASAPRPPSLHAWPSMNFETVDVFTDRRFGGNPLAVLTDARGLSGRDDAGHRARVQPVGDDVRAAAARPGAYRPGADLHARRRSCRSPVIRMSARRWCWRS